MKEEKKGTIIIPETAKEKPQKGVIVEIPEDTIMKVAKGDKVLFGKYAGTEIEVDKETYLLMSEEDILAIIRE